MQVYWNVQTSCIVCYRWTRDCQATIYKHHETTQKILFDYNDTLALIGNESQQVALEEVLSPDSEFWINHIPPPKPSSQWHHVPWDKKKDMIQAHLLLERSKEELSLLMEEKQNLLDYWTGVKATVHDHLTLYTEQTQTPYSAWSISLLRKYLVEAEYQSIKSSLCGASFLPTFDHSECDESDDVYTCTY